MADGERRKAIYPWYTYPITLHWHERYGGELERGNDLAMAVGVPVYAWAPGVVLTRTDNKHAKGDQPPPAPNPNPNDAYAETGYNHWGGEVDWYQPNTQRVNYAMHLDSLAVNPGDQVQPGQIIGFSGGENTLDESNVVPGYTPTHTADPNTSSGPHIEVGMYDPHDYGHTWDPAFVINTLRKSNSPEMVSPPSCGSMPNPYTDAVSFANWVACVSAQKGSQVSKMLDPSAWVAAINAGFGAPLQRIGLIAFGGLLVLIGLIVLFFGPVEHAAEQAAPMAAMA